MVRSCIPIATAARKHLRNITCDASKALAITPEIQCPSSGHLLDVLQRRERRDLPKELAEESTTYREARDKILNYCAPDCNLDMLKRDLLDIKQEPDEAATKFLKRNVSTTFLHAEQSLLPLKADELCTTEDNIKESWAMIKEQDMVFQ
uniref:Uncharacterized protein n=1 Tax=Romanomermis culicivorax TaxID=13658 RepID=A0A915JVN3_ROMCU